MGDFYATQTNYVAQDADGAARKHLKRYGSGEWIDREAPILAALLMEFYEKGRKHGPRPEK